jgi:hypothetical protein
MAGMTKPAPIDVETLTAEFLGAAVGDARLQERLQRIVALTAMDPAESFPEQMGSVADREALYRFLANDKVTLGGVLQGHVAQTHVRIQAHARIRIVHDTTAFRFTGDRAGLGIIRHGVQGFLGHIALAVTADDTREPLGVLGVRPYIHADARAHRGMTQTQRMQATHAKPRAAKESARWEQLALQVSADLPAGVEAVHVMDQEADDYDLLAALHAAQRRYVVRMSPRRRTTTARRSVTEVLGTHPATLFRTVALTPRRPRESARTKGRHPVRAERDATLQVRWAPITLPRQCRTASPLPTLTAWAVHVWEPTPPPGEVPIEWMLCTSETVDTLAKAATVVDHYRSRWIIEEYFKALKTGCAFEKRQLTTYDGLVRALALFIPLAWQLLVLRHLGRAVPSPSVTPHFDREQLRLLRKLLERRRYHLPAHPTMRDAMLGIAALGGHITNNGPPGWLVLGRGLTRFLEAELGWCLAREEM